MMPTPPFSFLLEDGGAFRVGARGKRQTNEQPTHQDSPAASVRQDPQQHHGPCISLGVASMAEQRPLLDCDTREKAQTRVQESTLCPRLAQGTRSTVGRLHRGPLGEQSERVEVARRSQGSKQTTPASRSKESQSQGNHNPVIHSNTPQYELTPATKTGAISPLSHLSRKER